MTLTSYDIGDTARVAITFRNTAGADADPTAVEFKFAKPDGNVTTYVYGTDAQIVKDAVGKYHVDLVPDQSGFWSYRWKGTGTVTETDEGQFWVLMSAFGGTPVSVAPGLSAADIALSPAISGADDVQEALGDLTTNLGELVINVKASPYNAVGDGVADDTAAIQAAITAASAAPGRVIFFPGGRYKVSSTLQVNARGIRFVGARHFRPDQAGGSRIQYTGTGACVQLGTDSGNAYDTSEYNGAGEDFSAEWIAFAYTGSGLTALSNGLGNYKADCAAIRDWRGGAVYLNNVSFEWFHYGFWGIQSDVNSFLDVRALYCKVGIYLGPRSDQNTVERFYGQYNDTAVHLDGAWQTRFRDSQFVINGSATTPPIKLGSAWARGLRGAVFDDCWFEHLTQVGGSPPANITAFIDIGVGEPNLSQQVFVRHPNILTNNQVTNPHAAYFMRIGNADYVMVEDPFSDTGNLAKFFNFVETSGAKCYVRGLSGSFAHYDGQNDGTGSPFIFKDLWSAGFRRDQTQFFEQPTTGGAALRLAVRGEATHRMQMLAGGQMSWGDGTAAPDTVLGRDAAGNRLTTVDQIQASDGLITKTKAGAVSDADFAVTPLDGALAVDSTNNRLYTRIGAAWRSTHERFDHFISGRWYGPRGASAGTSNTLGNGNLRVAPMTVGRPITLDRIGIEITAAGSAGATLRLGIYNDNGNGYPGSLVLDAGTVAADAVASPEIIINQALAPGVYWIGAALQGAPATQPTVRAASVAEANIGSTTIAQAANANGYAATGITGALPNPFTAGVGAVGSLPRVVVRVA